MHEGRQLPLKTSGVGDRLAPRSAPPLRPFCLDGFRWCKRGKGASGEERRTARRSEALIGEMQGDRVGATARHGLLVGVVSLQSALSPSMAATTKFVRAVRCRSPFCLSRTTDCVGTERRGRRFSTTKVIAASAPAHGSVRPVR
jgi:hypothetical protein